MCYSLSVDHSTSWSKEEAGKDGSMMLTSEMSAEVLTKQVKEQQ